jgi:hypothetical protein
MAHFRLYKSGSVAHVEACIIETLRKNECMTTSEILECPNLRNHFHGMRTLDLGQVARVLKRMVADGRLESGFHGQGMFTGRNYRLASK